MNNTNRGMATSGERAVTIKRGNAPEIQAVDISVKKIKAGKTMQNDGGFINAPEVPFRRRRPVSKTMTTTKSTMTNDEDYQIDVVKYVDDDNASHTTMSHQANDSALVNHMNDVIHVSIGNEDEPPAEQKPVVWKEAPKVHFPIGDDSLLSSPVPMESLLEFEDVAPVSTKVVEWDHLQNLAIIEPPYEHRPDTSYLVQGNEQVRSNPIKVWPGYGGNIYFEPVLVESKPIYHRDGQQVAARCRSRATSRYTFGETTTSPDAFSDSRYFSIPPSTPIQPGTRRDTPAASYRYINSIHDDELPFQRQMAHLDRDYILNMKVNPKIHEDWSWIAGMESIGTLCIADASEPLEKRKPIPLSRTLIVEKIPRKFTYHPGNSEIPGARYRYYPRPVPLVQAKIKSHKRESNPSRRYNFKSRSLLRSSSRLSQERKIAAPTTTAAASLPDLRRVIRLPNIPIRITGKRENEVHFYDPWDMSSLNQTRSNFSRTKKDDNVNRTQKRSRIMSLISQSRNSLHSTQDKENLLPFSVKSWPKGKKSELKSHPRQSDQDTDDEDVVNYETLRSAYLMNRDDKVEDGKRDIASTTA